MWHGAGREVDLWSKDHRLGISCDEQQSRVAVRLDEAGFCYFLKKLPQCCARFGFDQDCHHAKSSLRNLTCLRLISKRKPKMTQS